MILAERAAVSLEVAKPDLQAREKVTQPGSVEAR
jgi:hypothetical protein